MKLAALGTDSDVLALLEAAQQARHEVVWLGDVRPEDMPGVQRLFPGLEVSADWESLLDHGLVDAVLVGRGTTDDVLQAEQLKRLVAGLMPVLAIHPVGASVLFYYELDMARHEVHGVLCHYTPLAGSPAVNELAKWVGCGNGPIGTVHQVICLRNLADCGRESVIRYLARDVELLNNVAGGVQTVNAVGPRVADATYASLQVQMTCPGAATLRWAVTPTTVETPPATLTLVGERGSATLELLTNQSQLTTCIGGKIEAIDLLAFNSPRAAIDQLAASLSANGTDQSAAACTWQAATAAMEIVDTIELSLQKGRTIEVHQQRLTERLAFRGTMAAFGCGLLLFVFFALIGAGLLGDVLGVPLKNYWPLAMLAVLTLFLAFQALPWLVTRRRPVPNPAGDRAT